MEMDCSTILHGGDQISNDAKEKICGDNIVNDLLIEKIIVKDLDSYWDDINDRLLISRMVSDSVIKGMVNAIEQEAVDKIAQKELVLSKLKKRLDVNHVVVDEFEPLRSAVDLCNSVGTTSCLSESGHHDTMTGFVGRLKMAAKEQFQRLIVEIEEIKSDTIRRNCSGSQIVGLGGLLQDKVSARWDLVDKMFESLQDTLENFYGRVDSMARWKKALLYEWQQEQDFQEEVEGMVIRNCIQVMQDDFEQKLRDHDAQTYRDGNLNWLNTVNEISKLRQELDSISKFLSDSDSGLLIGLGSLDNGDDYCNNKRIDHLYWKLSTIHSSPVAMHKDGNGKLDQTNSNLPENLDPALLKELGTAGLIHHFNSQMTKLKRNHESQVQEIIEENFRLKREILRAKDLASPLKKDKDFDIFRKRIPDFISKLDEILAGSEKIQAFTENLESLGSLNGRLESLHVENCQLRDEVIDKKREIISLSSECSETAAKFSQWNLIEQKLLEKVQELEFTVEDAQFEISITHGIYKCLLEEIEIGIRSISEDSDLECTALQEIYGTIYTEALRDAQPTSISEIQDAEVKEFVMQGLLVDIFREGLEDAKDQIKDITVKYDDEHCSRMSIEKEALEFQERLRLAVVEKEIFHAVLSSVLQEKEESVKRLSDSLAEGKKKMDLLTKDLYVLRDQTIQQQKIISDSSRELDVSKSNLVEAQNRIKSFEMKTSDLHQKLEIKVRRLHKLEEDKRAAIQDKQNALFIIEKNESEYKKQIKAIVNLVHAILQILADFEIQVEKDILRHKSRLEKLSSEFLLLLENASILTNTLLVYKQRFGRKCSNLEKAEAEVDMLGDEVDMLLNLLEKIYISLDHYSPVLQHYSGITEILELVKRELSGGTIRPI